MEDADRAREYARFTRPPQTNRFATTLWRVQAARHRRKVSQASPDANRQTMRDLEASITDMVELKAECEAELASNPNAAIEVSQAERSLHQLKAMWFWTYEAAVSNSSRERHGS